MITIESGIPIPPKRGLKNLASAASAVRAMEVGDSVLVATLGKTKALRVSARRFRFKIAQRQVEGGIRVWRVA